MLCSKTEHFEFSVLLYSISSIIVYGNKIRDLLYIVNNTNVNKINHYGVHIYCSQKYYFSLA